MREAVAQALEEVRGMLPADGGDIELIDVSDDETISVRLTGACAGCPMSQMTLRQGVETRLKERVPAVKAVVAV